jgi:hypothetical protein
MPRTRLNSLLPTLTPHRSTSPFTSAPFRTRAISTLLPVVHSASNLLLSHGPYDAPELVHTVRTRMAHDRKRSMEEIVVPFFTSTPTSACSRPVGFLRPQVLRALEDHHARSGHRSPWHPHYSPERRGGGPWAVSFAAWVNDGGFPTRSSHMNHLLAEWREAGIFPSILRGPSLSKSLPFPIGWIV